MERGAGAPLATFYAVGLTDGAEEISLGAAAAHHATVRRLSNGDEVRLTNGSGRIAAATIARLTKGGLVARLREPAHVPPLPLLELLVPVADRDRMLWLAEKASELGVTVWQPVVFARSRSVLPRGEGEGFAVKVRARMIAALEQSGGAWLPDLRRELPLADAVARTAARARLVLDRDGRRLDADAGRNGAAVIFGPEGGMEASERALLRDAGWRGVALAPTTLRFETAGIAAVAILRAGAITVNPEV